MASDSKFRSWDPRVMGPMRFLCAKSLWVKITTSQWCMNSLGWYCGHSVVRLGHSFGGEPGVIPVRKDLTEVTFNAIVEDIESNSLHGYCFFHVLRGVDRAN